tara:strand:+ start:4917 stop:8573 length:3657 start_codon:yes stop_codon:yes gene_type:complete
MTNSRFSQEEIDTFRLQQEDQQREKSRELEQRKQDEAIQEDPRDVEEGIGGLQGLIKEGQSILSGGLQDTASSIATFPERTADALSGQMQKEKEKYGEYRPEWSPFGSYDNPIETKTWWGKQLRALVHFGSMSAAALVAAKGVAATGIVSIPAGLVALTKGNFIRGMALGAATDLVSKESDGQNALGALRERYGWADTPLATKDTDHPIMMKIKNIVEGMGIGLFFDGLLYTVKKGSQPAIDAIIKRNKSLKDQTVANGLAQLRRGEAQFRADKNAPISQPHQGAHITEVDPDVAKDQLSRTRKEWGAEEGSTGSVTTPLERERIAQEAATDAAQVERIYKGLVSSEKFAQQLDAAKGDRVKLAQTFKESVEAHQRITLGRNAADLSANEYLKELLEAQPDIIDGVEVWTSKNVVIADLVSGTLLRQLRDLGIAGREIADLVDLNDIDGPAKQIVDTMLTALYQTKKARFVKSDSFRALSAGKGSKKVLEDAMAQEMADMKESVMTMLKIANEDPSDNLMNALFEAFSMMKDLNTLEDFDRWARTVLKGGSFEGGPARTGALIKELEGVMTHSILSGPKTPIRAIMGTSTATFMRPLATALGAVIRLPFTGDAATVRSSLASANALIDAVPESFDLFRSRLNSYFKGDIKNIKTRYTDFTQNDANWEILRRWAEDSGRADPGEQAAFALANMARGMNNSNLLTYSTKMMAATDDSFAYILGRAKMREKAMRRVLDMQGNGIELPEITPELMKAYEDDFYSQVFDAQGNIIDEATEFARKEVTLTQDLTGFSKGLNDVFSGAPLARPFFLFARTGVNGLALTGKHTPGFNFLVKEFNDIAFANPNDISGLAKYGINSVEELMNAKSLQTGRLAIGAGVVFMAAQAWMRGDLTGNGPVDRQTRQVWVDGGWKGRSCNVGGVLVGYDSMEPFNLIMSTICDIGDASQLMGEEWTENQLGKVSLVVAQAVTSKSYLAGIQSFVDLFGAKPGQGQRIVAGLVNNTVPLSGLRNELGKLFTPYMREIGSGIGQSIRNRNLITEQLGGARELPIKYDILNGKPVKDWDFLTRAYNGVSPIPLNLEQNEGRKLLWNSGYDLRQSIYYAPDGTNLTKDAKIRSLFAKAIGEENAELDLIKLSRDPRILASMEERYKDIKSGNRGEYDNKDYYHNRVIGRLMAQIRRRAWDKISGTRMVQEVIQEQLLAKQAQRQKQIDTGKLLSMYK